MYRRVGYSGDSLLFSVSRVSVRTVSQDISGSPCLCPDVLLSACLPVLMSCCLIYPVYLHARYLSRYPAWLIFLESLHMPWYVDMLIGQRIVCQYVNISICQYLSMSICQYVNMSPFFPLYYSRVYCGFRPKLSSSIEVYKVVSCYSCSWCLILTRYRSGPWSHHHDVCDHMLVMHACAWSSRGLGVTPYEQVKKKIVKMYVCLV